MRNPFVQQRKKRSQVLTDKEAADTQTRIKKDEINIWDNIKQTYLKATEKCFGTKQKKKKEWISNDTK